MSFAWPIMFVLTVLARDAFGISMDVPLIGWLPPAIATAAALVMVAMFRAATRQAARRGSMNGYIAAETFARHAITATILATALGVLIGGWLDIIRRQIGDLVLIDELLATFPIVLVFVARAWAEYPMQRVLHEASLMSALDAGRPIRPMPGRGAWVLASLRPMAALAAMPMLVVYGVLELVAFASTVPAVSGLGIGLDLAAVLVLVSVLPGVVVRVLGARREAGIETPLRERMAGFDGPVRRVLLWDTCGTQANAAIMGVTPWRRTLLVTDVVLESLTDDELGVVLAHEAGHVRFRHLPWLIAGAASFAGIGAIIGSLAGGFFGGVVASLAGNLVSPLVAGAGEFGAVLVGVVFGLVGLGPLSRRMEWQADAHAVRCVSRILGETDVSEDAAERVSGVLMRVGRLNGVAPSRPSWRHGSMNRRAAQMRTLIGHQHSDFPVDRLQRRIRRWTVVAGLVCVAAALISG